MHDRPVKIVSYNILDGGLGRLDPIYETLLYLDADVIGLCEADDARGVRYLAEKLGMDYAVAEGPGKRGVALLSRLPIEEMMNFSLKHPELDKGAMSAVVRRADGSVLRAVLVHLEAGQCVENESRRLTQISPVLDGLRGSGATVLMGDFNSAAPYHPFDYESASPKIKQRLVERGTQDLDHDVVDLVTSRDWVDAYHRLNPVSPRHTFTTGFPATRYDYIWLSPDLGHRLVASGVEQGGFAPYCSDHYPIWATIA